jgi:hypothetical protein
MKEFRTQVPLHQYFELGGTLQANQALICIEHYPCIFLSKRMKIYRDRDGINQGKLMHYKVEMVTNGLYKKGKIVDCFENELGVWLSVIKAEPIIIE